MYHEFLFCKYDDDDSLIQPMYLNTDNFPDTDMVVNEKGIAHDLVEHVNGVEKIGSIKDELEAIGALWVTRGQFDARLRLDDALYIVFDDLQCHMANSNHANCDDNYIGPCNDSIEPCEHYDSLLQIIRQFAKRTQGENNILGNFCRNAIRLMCIGANKQTKRFNNDLDANTLFNNIRRMTMVAMENLYSDFEDNDIAVIRVDYDTLDVSWYTI